MIEMVLYGIGVMYTPGPINLLGLNSGINKKLRESIGFFSGVGLAMLILFLVFGYTGERFIKKEYLIYISIIGSMFILYLAIKILLATVQVSEKHTGVLSFKDGLLMHIMNPKATLATLPIATIHYPANDITGIKILIASLMLAMIAALAPTSYAILGQLFGSRMKQGRGIKVFNVLMALLLVYVAGNIFYDHVYLVIIGVNEY